MLFRSESNAGKIIVEDESNFDFELIQLCSSTDPDLFDYKININEGAGPFAYTIDGPELITGEFSGSDTNVYQIPFGDYQVTVLTQCVEKMRSISLARGEGIREGDFQILIDTLQSPDCEDQFAGAVQVRVEPESSDYRYRWLEENTEFEDGFLTGLSPGINTIEVIDSLGCGQMREIGFNLEDDMFIDWSPEETQLCPGETSTIVNLLVSVNDFQISVDGGNILENPEFLELQEGTHELLVASEAGCQIDTVLSVGVVTPYMPELNEIDEVLVFKGDSILISLMEPPAGSIITWKHEEHKIGNEAILEWEPSRSGVLNLEVVYPPGCKFEKDISVQVLEKPEFSEELLPNAFSPNGDRNNDVLKIPTPETGLIAQVYQMDIFDRYGKLVYSKSLENGIDTEITWDGKIGDAAVIPDVYLAKAELRLSDGSRKSIAWNVHLIN